MMREWLEDPVKVFAALTRLIAIGCLLAGFTIEGIGGLVFGYLGTLALIGVERLSHANN